ncbi:MAG: hypothetical protein RLN60_02730 [Phycisphaerales bacterium]
MSRTGRLPQSIALALGCITLLAGCRTAPTLAPDAPEALPTYESLAAAHNANVNRFDTLWARVIGTVSYINDKGDRVTEQGEGNLQLVKPSRIALSIGKLGEVIAWIGADEAAYWFLEPSAEPRRGVTGSHERFSADTRERLGLPVSPLAVIEALGVTPLPAEAESTATWDATRNAVIHELPAERRRYAFDLERKSLIGIDFLGEGDEPLATVELRDEVVVTLPDEGGYFPRIAKRVEITDPSSGASFRITLSDCAEKPIKPRVFDLAQLVDAFLIEHLTDLDR